MRAPNTSLRPLLSLLLTPALALACALPARAQATATPAAAPPAAGAVSAAAPGAAVQVQRIDHEDALSRIEEVRANGETRSIVVQPKNGAPGYEIVPESGAKAPLDAGGSSGRSRWRILNF
jgi:hypothetical protein